MYRFNAITIMLYSFIGVNKRFNELASDMIYTRSIDLIQRNDFNDNCSLTSSTFDRLYLHILPQIHERVECLNFNSIFMEHILSAVPP